MKRLWRYFKGQFLISLISGRGEERERKVELLKSSNSLVLFNKKEFWFVAESDLTAANSSLLLRCISNSKLDAPPSLFFPKSWELVSKWPSEIDTGYFRKRVRRWTRNYISGRSKRGTSPGHLGCVYSVHPIQFQSPKWARVTFIFPPLYFQKLSHLSGLLCLMNSSKRTLFWKKSQGLSPSWVAPYDKSNSSSGSLVYPLQASEECPQSPDVVKCCAWIPQDLNCILLEKKSILWQGQSI